MHSSYSRRNAVGMTLDVTPPEKRLRMIVMGASGVGKTQLVSRFLGRPFNTSYLPTVEEFHRSKYVIDRRTYQLDILDTAGYLLSPVMQNLTILTGDLFIVVYSVTQRESWERAKEIVAHVEEMTSDPRKTNKCIERSFKSLLYSNGATTFESKTFANSIQQKQKLPKKPTPMPILLAGNKFDSENIKVQPQEIRDWLRQRQTKNTSTVANMYVSAKSGYQVDELYKRLFSMARLPKEMSPIRNSKDPQEHNETFTAGPSRSKSEDESVMNSENDHSLCMECEKNHSGAKITVSLNQRRPSVDTEVLLAFTKIRTYSPETKRRVRSEGSASAISRLFVQLRS